MKKICCIYKITCLVNGKIYIGSAMDYDRRKRQHLRKLQLNNHRNSHLQFAYNLYTECAFQFEIVETIDNEKHLLEREQYWIDKTNCYDKLIGFNICKVAGSSLGVKRSDEFKEKIRQANNMRSKELKDKVVAAVRNANTGRPPWNRGVKMWETREHPRANLGKKFPNRKPMSEAAYKNLCEINRLPKSAEYLRKRSFISSKAYYFICPKTGCELKVVNLKEFCLSNGLRAARMYQVANGNETHHKGWVRDEYCYVNPN